MPDRPVAANHAALRLLEVSGLLEVWGLLVVMILL
jgi:hypothetical protein